MKKISFVLVCALAVMLFAGCTTFIPGGVGTGELRGSKVGESTMQMICGFPLGDASILTAAANGGITNVSSFDVKVFTVAFFYVEATTIVTGD